MLESLPNAELLRALCQLVTKDRSVEAEILAHLGEVDARQLYLAAGCPSMFRFCTDVLHFSEATAFHRIRAARVCRTYPIVLERVRRGEIHLAGITLLAPNLTPENHTDLLRDDARRKKFAETSRPRRQSTTPVKTRGATRHIPAKIKRAVATRDAGRCAFVSRNGRRCGSAEFVEYHHINPWARSRSHSVEGIELRCRQHNQYAEDQDHSTLSGESWVSRGCSEQR